jgi:hypothetical protein
LSALGSKGSILAARCAGKADVVHDGLSALAGFAFP